MWSPTRVAATGLLAAVALSTGIARADEEIPAGHFYFGFTAELAQPFGRALISRETLGLGSAGGLYAHYEGARFLIGAEITGGHFKNDDTYSDPFIIALRGGPVFGSGPSAFYVAAGPALLAYGAVGDDAAGATGLSGEIGVLLFRQMRWFRATAFAQYNLPLWRSASGKGDENVLSLSWAALGLRLQF